MRSFAVLARHLSFRQAAQELGITQPALSGQIKSLERHLGVQLFFRTTRRVALTGDGERCLVHARRLLQDLEGTLGEMRSPTEPRVGRISFACIPSIVLSIFPKLLTDFARMNPDVQVEVSDDATVTMEQRLINRELEFGIGGPPTATDNLEFMPVVEDPFVFVCRADHPLAKQSRISVKRALRDPLISLAKGSNVHTVLGKHLARRRHSFSPALELTQFYSVFSMIDAGMGVSLLPSMACEMIKVPSRLRTLRLDDPTITRPVGLIKLQGSSLAPPARDLYELARKIILDGTRKNRGGLHRSRP
jgi:DNA-binding transcriptional LysR family regulator